MPSTVFPEEREAFERWLDVEYPKWNKGFWFGLDEDYIETLWEPFLAGWKMSQAKENQ